MKVYNLENIKSATELKHWTEVINMNERSIIVLDTFTSIAQKLQAVSISLFHVDIEEVMSQLLDHGLKQLAGQSVTTDRKSVV